MKLHSFVFFTINLIILCYWPIKNSVLSSYAKQHESWDIATDLTTYKTKLQKQSLESYNNASTLILKYDLLELLLMLNEEINSSTFTTLDSLINIYNHNNRLPYTPNHNISEISTSNQYPSGLESILKKLATIDFAEHVYLSTLGCNFILDRFCVIKIPNNVPVSKYCVFGLASSFDSEITFGNYLVIGNDTILDPLEVPYKLTSPFDSTTLIHKYVKLYNQKDSLLSTYKTKIIELD